MAAILIPLASRFCVSVGLSNSRYPTGSASLRCAFRVAVFQRHDGALEVSVIDNPDGGGGDRLGFHSRPDKTLPFGNYPTFFLWCLWGVAYPSANSDAIFAATPIGQALYSRFALFGLALPDWGVSCGLSDAGRL